MRVSEEPVCYYKIQFLPPCIGDPGWTGDFKCREVKTGFCRNRSMQTGSSVTLIGRKSGQFVPLWDRMEGAWLWTMDSGGKSCICVAKTIEEGLDRETERLYQLDDHVQDWGEADWSSSRLRVIQDACTVKRVDEVVRHPHLVTQDQFRQVSKKVSDIPEENFTLNIELIVYKCRTSSTEFEFFKSSTTCGLEPSNLQSSRPQSSTLPLRHTFLM